MSRPCAFVETLEPRVFLSAARITSFFADNRGRFQLNFDQALNLTNLDVNHVKIFTAGTDGVLGTADDVWQSSAKVNYNSAFNRISSVATLTANTPYRVWVDGNSITGSDGQAIDVEYNGANATSGNGTPGGILQFITKPFADGKLTAKFVVSSTLTGLSVKLRPDVAPIAVANFVAYANAGSWDNTIMHRSDYMVIQGGRYYVQNSTIYSIAANAPIALERGLSNIRGTIGMARMPDPNSATTQWYFNVQDNLDFDPPAGSGSPTSGYCAFGTFTVPDAYTSMDTINGYPVTDLFPSEPLDAFNTVPTAPGNYFVSVTRVSFKMDTAAVPVGAGLMAAPSAFNTTTPITFGASSDSASDDLLA